MGEGLPALLPQAGQADRALFASVETFGDQRAVRAFHLPVWGLQTFVIYMLFPPHTQDENTFRIFIDDLVDDAPLFSEPNSIDIRVVAQFLSARRARIFY